MGVHFERGQVLFEMGRYREAAKEYLAELAEEPQHVPSLINLGAALINDDDISGAVEAVEAAIALEPEHSHAYFVLCHIELKRRNVKKAKRAIDEAIRLTPIAPYFTKLASILNQEGRKLESADAVSKALELDPTCVPAILLRGQMLADGGRTNEANELFALALRESPEEAKAQLAMGRLQLAKGDAAKALDLLTEARRIDPMASNNRSAVAAAYGLNLWPFRAINRFVARWYYWPFKMQWLLSLVLTTIFSLVSLEISQPTKSRSEDAFFKHPWWLLYCVLLANYLLLPYSFSRLARSTAYFVAKRQLDIRWYSLLLQPARLIWLVTGHLGVSFVGMICSTAPELAAMIFAMWVTYPLVAEVARSSARQFTYYICVPVLAISAGMVVVSLSVVAYGKEPSAFYFVAIYFAIAYFNELLARWASSVRLF